MRRLVHDGVIGAHRAGTAERAPVLVSRNEVEGVVKARKGFVPAKKFGFPVMVLQSLATASLLEIKANPPGLALGFYYLKSSVDALVERLDCRAHPISARTDVMDLRQAALLAGSPGKNPWPGIFRGILEGHLQLFSRISRNDLAGRYMLEDAAIPYISERALPWPKATDRVKLTRADIGFLLDLPTPLVHALIQEGILSGRPSLEDVQRFHEVYVMRKEATHILRFREGLKASGAPGSVSLAGIVPAYTTTYLKRRVWRRSDVLQLI